MQQHNATFDTPHRRTWMRLSILLFCWLIAPILLLGALELGLRLARYGVNPNPFFTTQTKQGPVHLGNPEYLHAMFTTPPQTATPQVEYAIPEKKEAGTYRIFLFGSSAAFGWTHSASFVHFLHFMLLNRYPGIRFEIFNLANGGLNSAIMRPLARIVSDWNPDAFLIYMGNNEVHGPYGLISEFHTRTGTVFSPWQIQLHQQLRRLRLGQWLDAWSKTSFHTHASAKPSAPLRYDDPRVADVWRNYASNLSDMFQAGTAAGAQVFISTLGANLRHWPPNPDLIWNTVSQEDKQQLSTFMAAGKALETQDKWDQALEIYEQARKLSDEYPYLFFRQATCRWQLGEFDAARSLFVKALQQDSYIWVRAKPALNAVVVDAVKNFNKPGVVLVDGAARLSKASPHGTTGIEFFADGCHFRPAGMYVLAQAFFEQMVSRMPPWVRKHEIASAPMPTREDILFMLGMSDQLNQNVLEALLRESEAHEMDSTQLLRDELAHIQKNPVYLDEFKRLTMLEKYIADGVEDIQLAYKYLECIARNNVIPSAKQQLWIKRLAKRYAYDRAFQIEYANTAWRFLQDEDLVDVYTRVLDVFPQYQTAYTELFQLHLKNKNIFLAEATLQQAKRQHLPEEQLRNMQGAILQETNIGKAVEFWKRQTQSNPRNVPIELALARAQRKAKQTEDARNTYRRILESTPNHIDASLELAALEIESGNTREGMKIITLLENIPQVDPVEIGKQLGALAPIAGKHGDLDTAMAMCRLALQKSPQDLWPLYYMGELLERQGANEAAQDAYLDLLTKAPESPVTAAKLNALLQRTACPAEIQVELWQQLVNQHSQGAAIPRYYLSQAWQYAGNEDAATKALEQAQQINPEILTIIRSTPHE